MATGNQTSSLFGPYRMSHEGSVVFAVESNMIDKRADSESLVRVADQGSSMSTATGSYWGSALKLTLAQIHKNRTELPLAHYVRGAVSNPVQMARAQLGGFSNPQATDEENVGEFNFALSESAELLDGVVFEYSIAHPQGVSAPVDGPVVELGPLAADERFDFFFSNPHHPAPTITTASGRIRSASDQAFLTGVTDEVLLTDWNNTASYQLVTIGGPVTNVYWQLQITNVIGGECFPVLLAVKRSQTPKGTTRRAGGLIEGPSKGPHT